MVPLRMFRHRPYMSLMLLYMVIISLALIMYTVKEKDLEQITEEYKRQVTKLNGQLQRHIHEINANSMGIPTGKYFINKLPIEVQNILKNSNRFTDLHLPSIYDFLPHLSNNTNSLTPAFLFSKDKHSVSMVLGVPTVKRSGTSYLLKTLHSLINNMTPTEKEDVIIIVFIAELDTDYVLKVFTEIKEDFPLELDSGVIEVLSPPKTFYPNLDKLRLTLDNPLDRVKWRSKQNLDYAFLMMYAQYKGTFYVQLEDDITPQNGYITIMKNYALQLSRHKDWVVIDFSHTGFIGKMFKSINLSYFIEYFIIFFNDKPCDWLLEDINRIMSSDGKDKYYKPLFQHNGKVSSLNSKKGRTTRLRVKTKTKTKKLETHVSEKITDLKLQLQHSQIFNIEYRKTLLLLFQKYEHNKKNIQSFNNTNFYLNCLTELGNSTLCIPSVYNFLPHTLLTNNDTGISFKMSTNEHISDLVVSLLIDKKTKFEMFTNVLNDIMNWYMRHEINYSCTTIIFIAEWDLDYIKEIAMKIKSLFSDEIENGFIEIISPSRSMYPDVKEEGDQEIYKFSQEAKSNLDVAFLMMYAMKKGKLYLQLDEVKVENNWMLSIMDNYSYGEISKHSIESLLDFGGHGLKAKLFRTENLPSLIQLLIMFHRHKSSEIILNNYLETRYCRKNDNKCKNKRKILSFSIQNY